MNTTQNKNDKISNIINYVMYLLNKIDTYSEIMSNINNEISNISERKKKIRDQQILHIKVNLRAIRSFISFEPNDLIKMLGEKDIEDINNILTDIKQLAEHYALMTNDILMIDEFKNNKNVTNYKKNISYNSSPDRNIMIMNIGLYIKYLKQRASLPVLDEIQLIINNIQKSNLNRNKFTIAEYHEDYDKYPDIFSSIDDDALMKIQLGIEELVYKIAKSKNNTNRVEGINSNRKDRYEKNTPLFNKSKQTTNTSWGTIQTDRYYLLTNILHSVRYLKQYALLPILKNIQDIINNIQKNNSSNFIEAEYIYLNDPSKYPNYNEIFSSIDNNALMEIQLGIEGLVYEMAEATHNGKMMEDINSSIISRSKILGGGKKPLTKKSDSKKPSSKKPASKKPSPKKPASKKTSPKKLASKKSVAKK
jgi:hypothetical protein